MLGYITNFNPLLKTFTPPKLSIGFWGVDFWTRIFFDCLEALGISLALTPPCLGTSPSLQLQSNPLPGLGLVRYHYVSKSVLMQA